MKIALCTDTHAGVRGDSDTFANYQYKFWYDVFIPYLKANNINNIIHLGDITDRRKWVNYKTLNSFRQLIHDLSHDFDLKVIIGNHDTFYKNTNRINSMECLFSTHGQQEPFQWYSQPTEVFYRDVEHPLLFVPWINESNHDQTMEMIDKTSAKICLGHLNLEGFEMARGLMNTEGMDRKVFRKFDMTLSGHFHTRSHMDNIWYLGSPFEQTWIDYGEDRGFHVLDTETHDLEFVPNPHKMFFKIAYDGSTDVDVSQYENKAVKLIVNRVDDQYEYKKFVNDLEDANPWHLQIIDNTDESNTDDVEVEHIESKSTIQVLNEYVDQTKYDNKDSVKDLLRSLFQEAISN